MIDLKTISTWADWEFVERAILVDFTCVYTAKSHDVLNVWPAKRASEVLKLIIDWSLFTMERDVIIDRIPLSVNSKVIDKLIPSDNVVDRIVSSVWEFSNYTDMFGDEWDDSLSVLFISGGEDGARHTVTNTVTLESGKVLVRSITYIIDNQVVREPGLNVINIF